MASALLGIRVKWEKTPHFPHTLNCWALVQLSALCMADAQCLPGALVGSLGRGRPLHTVISLNRWGILWFTSLNLPPVLLQKDTSRISSTWWVALSIGILSRCLEASYLLELQLVLKENWRSPQLLPGLPTLCYGFLPSLPASDFSKERQPLCLSSCIAPNSRRHLSTCQVSPRPLEMQVPKTLQLNGPAGGWGTSHFLEKIIPVSMKASLRVPLS